MSNTVYTRSYVSMIEVHDQLKTCPKCATAQPLTCFYKTQSTCKSCCSEYTKEWYRKNKDGAISRAKDWVRSNPKQHRATALMRNYNLPIERYEAFVVEQQNRCAICLVEFTDEKRQGAFVDHDHGCCPGYKSCGKCIRGLICMSCNMTLGLAKDRPQILEKAALYLKERAIVQNINDTVHSLS